MNIHLARSIHLHPYDVVPAGPPQGHGRFTSGPDGPRRVAVSLPSDPMAVPRGDR